MKLNGLETTSTTDKITAILELLVPLMLITLVAVQIFMHYKQMQKMEQTQHIIILKQQEVIKNANTTADVGKKDEQKGKRKTAVFTETKEINSMDK